MLVKTAKLGIVFSAVVFLTMLFLSKEVFGALSPAIYPVKHFKAKIELTRGKLLPLPITK